MKTVKQSIFSLVTSIPKVFSVFLSLIFLTKCSNSLFVPAGESANLPSHNQGSPIAILSLQLSKWALPLSGRRRVVGGSPDILAIYDCHARSCRLPRHPDLARRHHLDSCSVDWFLLKINTSITIGNWSDGARKGASLRQYQPWQHFCRCAKKLSVETSSLSWPSFQFWVIYCKLFGPIQVSGLSFVINIFVADAV